MDAVLLGILAGALFGAMTVAVRWGLLRGGDPLAGAPVIAAAAFAVAAGLALLDGEGADVAALAVFFGIGICVPGLLDEQFSPATLIGTALIAAFR